MATVLNDHACKKLNHLFALENQLLRVGEKLGAKLRSSPATLRTHLTHASPDLVTKIEQNMTAVIDVLNHCLQNNIDPWDDREFFRLHMRSLAISFPDDFLDHVGEDELVEGYDLSRYQIFRNMRFMELTGYSLMQVLSFEWTELFDRATAITEQMIGYCDELLWVANKTIKFDISTHFIRELKSPDKQVLEIQFRRLAPLFAGPNNPCGIVGSCHARPVYAEKGPDNLAFI